MSQMHIRLGFEVGTGAPVDIPLKHLAVTGQTQESGKTTTLEALIQRSGLRALAFRTKRGEGAFRTSATIPPYFRERADWQYVEAILESAMRQRMRFERAWIMRATKGAKTLAAVRANVHKLQGKATRGMDQDVYMLLGEYLDLVVPLLDTLPAAPQLELGTGVNVMDLSPYPSQLQSLVIRSALEWVYEREQDTVTVLPEAWEFVPQARGSPVKLAAAQLARKGAALRNYLWLDSQDLAGVDKEILKQVAVWLIGVQREVNELKRSLAHIPAGVKRPTPHDVATLGRGQFWACWQGHAVKVYVQPAWLPDELAIAVSRGEHQLDDLPGRRPPQEEPFMSRAIEDRLDQLTAAIGQLLQAQGTASAAAAAAAAAVPEAMRGTIGDHTEEELYQRFKQRLIADAPALLKVLTTRAELEIRVDRPILEIDGTTLKGRLALLIAEGWFAEAKAGNAAFKELARRGINAGKPNVYRELDKLAELGFVTKEADGYKAVPDAKITVKK